MFDATAAVSFPANIWPWLFPLTYALHIAEEYAAGGGYTAYMARSKGVHLTVARFLGLTGFGFALILIGLYLATILRFPNFVLIILAAVFVANTVSHTLTTVRTSKYNPGLITALALWLPLGAATIYLLRNTMRPHRFALAILIGLGIQLVVSAIAARGGRLRRQRAA